MTDFEEQHVLYFSGKWNDRIQYFLHNLSSTKKPTLTIGESEDFALNGGYHINYQEKQPPCASDKPKCSKNPPTSF
jgi:hypothetical protein